MKTRNNLFRKMKKSFSNLAKNLKKQNSETGTTFIEVLVTIAIIAILMTTIAIAVIPFIANANVAKAKTDIGALKMAMTAYFLEHNDYPDPSTWTEDLKKYIQDGKVPNDPWTNEPFKYTKPGPEDQPFEIRSSGPDKTEGNEDDIVSWKLGDENKDKNKNK
jgi:general secretion pathway protein G